MRTSGGGVSPLDRRALAERIARGIPSAFVVKLKPQDVEESFFWKGVEFARVEQDLKAELRRLYRGHERGLLSRRALSGASVPCCANSIGSDERPSGCSSASERSYSVVLQPMCFM